MIGIIGALEEEIAGLRHDMEISSISTIGGCEYISGILNNQDIVITRCGMGKVNAASCASTMIDKFSPDIIINTGVGGALDENLQVFDIVIAEDVVQYDYDVVSLGYELGQVDNFDTPYFICDPKANSAIMESTENLGYVSYFVRFATGDRFIDLPDEKRRIAETFDARVCEMETGAIAQVCALRGVRFSSIRSISDSGSGTDGAMQFQKFLSLAAMHSVMVIEDILRNARKYL